MDLEKLRKDGTFGCSHYTNKYNCSFKWVYMVFTLFSVPGTESGALFEIVVLDVSGV